MNLFSLKSRKHKLDIIFRFHDTDTMIEFMSESFVKDKIPHSSKVEKEADGNYLLTITLNVVP